MTADQSQDCEYPNPILLDYSDCVRVLVLDEPDPSQAKSPITIDQLIDFLSLCIVAIAFIYITGKWIAPLIITKIIAPMLKWEATLFTRPTLALILASSLALSPVCLLPSGPSMYLSGLFFGYQIGFIIIIIGTTIGIILPFAISSKFPKSINKLLARCPNETAYVKLCKGSWFHQFWIVSLFRLASLKYTIVNYSVGVTSVNLWAYICGSIWVMIPEAYLYLFSAKVVRICAELKNYWNQHDSDAVFFVVSAALALCVYVWFLVYQQKSLRQLQNVKENGL